jgi:hypothetical protein
MAGATRPLEGAFARNERRGAFDRRSERAPGLSSSLSCPAECSGCPTPGSASEEDPDSQPPLEGWPLIVTSICCFLLPLAAALLGAAVSGKGGFWQLAGALGGLSLAATGAAWLAARRNRCSEET